MSEFIIGRIKSIRYAIKGFFLLLTTENSIITQSFIALIFTGLGIYFEIDRVDWALQFLAIGLVLSIESLNTSVEKVCDFIHPDFHHKIGFIKDVASGAVTFAALTAFAIAMLIYWRHLQQLFF
jgi:diacylglycerol kinase (ATP)